MKLFFQKHTNNASKKVKEKKSSQKIAKTRFLYSEEYRDQKLGGKNARNNFFQKHTNIARKKMLGKKSSQKSAKTRFLYSH